MKRQKDNSLESITCSKLGKQNKQDAMGAYTSASRLWINCECGEIVKIIFFRYPSVQIPLLFSFCVTDVLTSSPEVC